MKRLRMLLSMLLVLMLSGCAVMEDGLFGDHNHRSGSSSSLVDFLYPDGKEPPPVDQRLPELKLPLRVGLAFVPSGQSYAPGLSEAHRQLLLEKVRAAFVDRRYISDIMVIPDTYMRRGGGFNNVEQVARLYGLDVMALVSYDQIAFVEENLLAFTYWTIVGAYVVRGNEHDVQTFVDTAVFDVHSHALLFRAPGHNVRHGTATLVGSAERLREAREQSFDAAVAAMIPNLDAELSRFETRVREGRAEVKVSGGGGTQDLTSLLFTGLFWLKRRQGRKHGSGSATCRAGKRQATLPAGDRASAHGT